MTPGGTITRQDLITNDALEFGDIYVAEIKKAITANDQLVKSAKDLAVVVNSYRKAENQQQFIEAKQAEILISQKAVLQIKEQTAAETAAEKVKQETLRTRKLNIEVEQKEQKAKDGTIKLTIEERVQNEINNKILKQEALERLGLVSAYTKLNKSRTDAKKTLQDLIASESASTAEIKKAQREFDLLDGKVRKADRAVNDFTKNVGNYPLQGLANGLKDLIGAFGLAGGIGAFAGIIQSAYEKVKEFNQGVADLSAITGASGKDLEYLKNQAIELGKSTKGGAVAVVEAYKLIGSAKPELLDDVKALNQVTEATLTLAKAAGMEMPDAATALTDAMNQFGADASKSQVFIDALANGAKYGAAEIPQVTEALLKFGAVARSSNINIKESTALIELLAENGIKGADAGTALRNVLLKISAPDALPKAAQQSLRDLGISFELLKDKSVPIQQKFEALKPLLADNAKLLKTFGFENIVAAQNVIEHTDRLKDLTSKMGEYGTAQEQADIRTNTLQGDTDKMSSTYDSLVLSIGKGSGVITNFFRFFVQGTTEALNGLIRLNTSWDDLFKKAQDDGSKNGKRLFDERFNSMIGDNLSDAQRDKIRERIKQINAEIAKGSKDKNLQGEKTDLFRMLGTGNELDVSFSIAKVAEKQAKIYEKALLENSKKLKEAEDGKYGLRNPFAPTPRDLKVQREELLKSLAEQNAIVLENNKKARASRIKIDPNIPANTTVDLSDADNKKAETERLKRLKKIYDASKKAGEDEFKLSQFRKQVAIDFQKEIVDNEKESISDRISAYQNMHETISAKNKEAAEYELQQLGKYNEKTGVFLRELSDLQIDEIIKTGKTNEKLTAGQKLIYEKYKNEELLALKKVEADKQKIIDSSVEQVQKQIDKANQVNDNATNIKIQNENEAFERILKANIGNFYAIEKAKKKHEENLKQIDRQAEKDRLKNTIDRLQSELNVNDSILTVDKISTEKRDKIAHDLQKARAEYSKLDVQITDEDIQKKLDKEKKFKEDVISISQNLYSSIKDLVGAVFSAKIQNIDAEISKSDEYYANEIEKAGNDTKKKEMLQKEADKKRKELEKKKQEEQHKQAVANRLFALAEIGIRTAMGVMDVLSTGGGAHYLDFGTSAGVLSALVTATGLAQAAAVLATPLPAYKEGRKGGPKEIAMINDGGVTEVVTSADGSSPRMTTKKNAIVQLLEGDIVHKSVDDYNRYVRASILSGVSINNEKMNAYQSAVSFNVNNDILIDEMRKNTKAIENVKQNVTVNLPPLDLEHAIWAMNNKNWN